MNDAIENSAPRLRVIAWELTRSCVLSCRHCRASATGQPYTDECTTEECIKGIDSLASMGPCIVILTGGEPLLRDDVIRITRYGNDKGLRMVMATCGSLLTKALCVTLRDAGIARISLSLDGATAAAHDAFRGAEGAFDGLMRGIAAASDAGLPFQINTTITRSNLALLPEIYSLAVQLGAVSFHPFLMVPTGRAAQLAGEMLDAAEYKEALNLIYDLHTGAEITVKPTCAPHYSVVCAERNKAAAKAEKKQDHGLDASGYGCIGGKHFAFISHIGTVQACGFLDVPAGNLRAEGYDFRTIWETSELFLRIRNSKGYHGKCGACAYGDSCGGCRARAYAVHGDLLGEEPYCFYQPL